LAEQKQAMGDQFTPQIKIKTFKKGSSLGISIRDNAGGIPEEKQKHIFNPFYTTKPTGQGNTGLGLSISYDIIVTGHHGSLELQTDGQTFSEFQVKLPLT
jgi:signal transduction histidine kinase